jgi:hypothetical protein
MVGRFAGAVSGSADVGSTAGGFSGISALAVSPQLCHQAGWYVLVCWLLSLFHNDFIGILVVLRWGHYVIDVD